MKIIGGNKPRDMPTSLLKCSKHFNDLQICKKGMSRSIFTRKIKWDVIFVQYRKSFYTLRQKQMLHVLYNIIDISRKLFVNCACRYQDCEVYVSFFNAKSSFLPGVFILPPLSHGDNAIMLHIYLQHSIVFAPFLHWQYHYVTGDGIILDIVFVVLLNMK